jgi:hypothetical protein
MPGHWLLGRSSGRAFVRYPARHFHSHGDRRSEQVVGCCAGQSALALWRDRQGGVANPFGKARWRGIFGRSSVFWVGESAASGSRTGVKTFTEEAEEATKALLENIPEGFKATGHVGLFPCFTRGVNQYGKENIETAAIQAALESQAPKIPLRSYGMFAHGELGPSTFSGFPSKSNQAVECEQHSMSSILSIHTSTV